MGSKLLETRSFWKPQWPRCWPSAPCWARRDSMRWTNEGGALLGWHVTQVGMWPRQDHRTTRPLCCSSVERDPRYMPCKVMEALGCGQRATQTREISGNSVMPGHCRSRSRQGVWWGLELMGMNESLEKGHLLSVLPDTLTLWLLEMAKETRARLRTQDPLLKPPSLAPPLYPESPPPRQLPSSPCCHWHNAQRPRLKI